MSTYMFFYGQPEKERFVRLGEFSRNSFLYSCFSAPFEKIMKLTWRDLESAREAIEEAIDSNNLLIGHNETRIKEIAFFNNSVGEKVDAINSIKDRIDAEKEDLDELKGAWDFIHALQMVNLVVPVYIGLEIAGPTSEDIVE